MLLSRYDISARLFIICSIILLLGSTGSSKAEESLKLVSIPWKGKDAIHETYAPVTELIQRKLGQPVEMIIAKSYTEAGQYLHHQIADIAILGPKSYVEAKNEYPGIQYLATEKKPTAYYHSLIITSKASGLKSVYELKGKSFGFTTPESTSGYLYPRLMLQEDGIDIQSFFSKTYFLGKHDKVYEAVARQVIDGGGVTISILEQAIEKHGDIFTILKKSSPIPRSTYAVGAHVSNQKRKELQQILQEAEDDPTFQANSKTIKGFLIKDDSFYDIVREAIKLEQ